MFFFNIINDTILQRQNALSALRNIWHSVSSPFLLSFISNFPKNPTQGFFGGVECVLASYGCCNKVSQPGWLKTSIHSLTLLEARSPDQSSKSVWTLKRRILPCLLWIQVVSGNLWFSWCMSVFLCPNVSLGQQSYGI